MNKFSIDVCLKTKNLVNEVYFALQKLTNAVYCLNQAKYSVFLNYEYLPLIYPS